MNDLQQKIYNRFSRYVTVDTTSDPTSKSIPTTASQISFAHRLATEMKHIGLQEVEVDEFGFVTGVFPTNTAKQAPTIGLFAHMDTVCDFNGKNVQPIIHSNYQGNDIVINSPKNMVLFAKNTPNLSLCIGDDIITSNGETLLGGDDKIGIATIMTLIEHLNMHPEIEHGTIKVAFTIDEETGTGISYFDVEKFNADFAYTVDGSNLGEIDCGNFNADSVTINITGKSCHPGSAKGFMANPVRIAADIIRTWPEDKLPETTDGEDGFVLFRDISGNLEQATIQGLVREHDINKFEQYKEQLKNVVSIISQKYPNSKIDISFKEQYRNMREVLKEKPQAMDLLKEALKEANINYKLTQARGGTDGSQLSLRGLPTPNIFAGYENPHGPYEWVSMGWVEKTFNILLHIIEKSVK